MSRAQQKGERGLRQEGEERWGHREPGGWSGTARGRAPRQPAHGTLSSSEKQHPEGQVLPGFPE